MADTYERQLSRRRDAASENLVLKRIAEGDREALNECYDRFVRPIYSLARSLCGDDPTAEDVTQEVFFTVWSFADRFDADRGSASTWVLTIAHHKAVDAVRRRTTPLRTRTHALSDLGEELPPEPGADVDAVRAVVAGQVRSALTELPRGQRQVLLLAYYGGHTQSEIATLLDLPLGTVKSRTHSAMAHLHGNLRSLEPLV